MARVEIFQPKTDGYSRRLAKKHVEKLVKMVEFSARMRLLRYTGNTVMPPPTGRHSYSIRSVVSVRGPNLVVGRVGSSLPTAMVVHNGARPHVIAPRNAGGLKFYWKAKGRMVCIKAPVNHPGMRGKFYLTHPLREIGPRLGFRVTLAAYSGFIPL